MASDLGCDLMLVSSHHAYPRLGIGFLAFLAFGLSCLIAFFRLSSDAGLATALASPCQEWSSLKQFLQSHRLYLPEGAERFHLSEPSAALAKLLGDGQTVI